MPAFEKANTQVLGISIDTFPSVGAFAKSLDLTFPLLSDFPRNETVMAYGTYNPERGTSRRITYVLDKEGVIQAEIVSDDDMSRHSAEALTAVNTLEGVEA